MCTPKSSVQSERQPLQQHSANRKVLDTLRFHSLGLLAPRSEAGSPVQCGFLMLWAAACTQKGAAPPLGPFKILKSQTGRQSTPPCFCDKSSARAQIRTTTESTPKYPKVPQFIFSWQEKHERRGTKSTPKYPKVPHCMKPHWE